MIKADKYKDLIFFQIQIKQIKLSNTVFPVQGFKGCQHNRVAKLEQYFQHPPC